MIVSLVFLAIITALIFFGIKKLAAKGAGGAVSGHSVRRFFQYGLQFGLVVVVAIGIAGLLGRFISPATLLVADQVSLARNFSFILVGLPVLIGVLSWTKRTVKSDSTEVSSFGWAAYIFLATVTSLAVAMFALFDLLSWAVGVEEFRSYAVAQFLIWGLIWAAHFEINRRATPINRSKFLFLFNSLIGLITSVVGIAVIVSAIAKRFIGVSGKEILFGGADPIKTGLVTFAVGVPVWLLYWIKFAMRSNRDELWLGYVLIAGVAGGLITTVISASSLLHNVVVWFIGDPTSTDFVTHFRSAPATFGALVAGLLLFWYHNSFASQSRSSVRNEVQRIYEYLISGIALLASAAGMVMVFVAVFEAFSGSSIVRTTSSINTLLAAFTLIAVGTPIWLMYWTRIQRITRRQPTIEPASSTRRIYLFLIFGIGGIVAVITLLTAVFVLLDSLFSDRSLTLLLREVRFPISILIATIAISAYHWSIYSAERDATDVQRKGPKYVVLIGPLDLNLKKVVKDLTGGEVQFWESENPGELTWSQDQVLNLVANSSAKRLVLTLTNFGVTEITLIAK